MTIVLLGYMGSGKSIVGRELALEMSYNFIDFDVFLEEKEGASIQSIFKRKGEIYFRRLEIKYLKEVLNIEESVIALGGGTPCYGNNIDVINGQNSGKSIYLKASISTLASRLFNERKKRPLIAHIEQLDDLQEFIGKHLFERTPYYLNANHTISTDNRTTTEIVQDITSQLF